MMIFACFRIFLVVDPASLHYTASCHSYPLALLDGQGSHEVGLYWISSFALNAQGPSFSLPNRQHFLVITSPPQLPPLVRKTRLKATQQSVPIAINEPVFLR